MRLITQRVHMNKCNCRDSRQITLDRDFNVPDAKPDALSIMKEQGNIQIEEVRMVDGKASIKGELVFQLLYAVDGEMPVNEMSGSIPFEEMIPLSCADRDDELTVNATVEDLRSELINSRKLGLKAVLTLEVVAETVCDGEGAVEIEEAEDVFSRKKTLSISRLVFSKKDTLRVRDEWKIPGTKEAIGQILYSTIRLGEINTRMNDNELQVDGQAQLFVIYLSDEELPQMNFYENTIPIEGKIECNGCEADMVAQVVTGIHSKDLEIKEDEDGESRVLDVELVIDFDIKVYGQDQMELLTDFYSTSRKCQPVYEDSYFENLIVQNKSKVRIGGKISADNDRTPLQIWDVNGELRIDHKEQQENGLLVEGVIDISVLYLTEDDRIPLTSVKGSLPFEQLVEAEGLEENSNIWLRGTLEQISGSLAGDKGIEIKAVAALELIAFERIEAPIITGYEEEEIDWKARSREPGIIGYVVQGKEELWDIAKKFFTTMSSIVEINHMEKNEVKEGDILLILKEVNMP
ncbi:MAG: DUF3794 domain-containing protein [Lachnospiraceae bacterium]|nr:DUF3794 domain-containing protein [Lachnospiraceae bacterium]